MKLPRRPSSTNPGQRGAALMLSLLVLFVLILIVSQISYSAKTDARVSRNEDVLIAMDLAIESVLLQAYEDLRTDAEADSASGGAGPGGLGAGPEGGEGEGEGDAPSDSREDEWSRPQRTEMNDLQIRVLIQDEDSKFNLLSILTENEDEADKAFERLVRVIEFSRGGTEAEIVGGDARHIATAMLEFMNRRQDQFLPVPVLLTDDEENLDHGLPLTMREFIALDPDLFNADLFRDYRDEDDVIVHSLGSFLTVFTSLGEEGPPNQGNQVGGSGAPQSQADDEDEPGAPDPAAAPGSTQDPQSETSGDPLDGSAPGSAPGGGGGGDSPDARINMNTAPPAVLKALLDDRDLPYRFWDDLIEFRNDPDDEIEENDDPPLDEYGEEIVVNKYFGSFDDIAEVDGWNDIEPIYQGELRNLLKTQSSVFSIFVTARKPTGEERIEPGSRREDIEREEAEGQGLVRTVRSVVWRKAGEDGTVEIVPLIRWEVIDYVPYEVRDFPEEDR